MKTDRLTLLITPADKAAIAARADALGLPVSEFVRRASAAYDPDEEDARAELQAFMPEFRETVDEIHATFERMIARLDDTERRLQEMDTPAYRDQVRRDLASDPTIDWEAVRRVFGERDRAA